jgi:hypothetical protein
MSRARKPARKGCTPVRRAMQWPSETDQQALAAWNAAVASFGASVPVGVDHVLEGIAALEAELEAPSVPDPYEVQLEADAELALLRWARSDPRGYGRPCLRQRDEGQKFVVDVNRWNSPALFSGPTWRAILSDVLTALQGHHAA